MTTWRGRLQPASFRGVPFFVDTSEVTGGRRAVVHEYPFRDTPYAEDLGRKARGFTIEGYVLGSDYFAARDALLAALETEGYGELVHPYFGRKRVVVNGDYRLRETASEGRIARFSVPFVETPAKPVQPAPVVDTASRVATSATNARTAVSNDFLAQYSPGLLLGSVSTTLQRLMVKVNSVIQTVQLDTQALALVKKQALDFSNSIATLIETPGNLVDDLVDIFRSFKTNLLDIYTYPPGARPQATTPDRAKEQTNFDAANALIRQLIVIRAAEVAPAQTYDSFESAVAAAQAITSLIDAEANTAGDLTYPALAQLRADLVNAVPGPNSDLSHVVQYTPRQTVPSLVLAYQLYQSVDLEADIIARNQVGNPGFIRGGTTLEVLANGS